MIRLVCVADPSGYVLLVFIFFFSSRRRHTRFDCDWSSDVCSSDLSNMLQSHGYKVTAVEFDSRIIGMAKTFFYLDPSVQTVADDARHYINTCHEIGRASCRERV